ncbi:hypothetical protein FORC065_3737 [Yersinia enterocolitica]|nr:hypothetical protein FORC065_3737 [Yersinia enterocolitica]
MSLHSIEVKQPKPLFEWAFCCIALYNAPLGKAFSSLSL